MPELKEKQEEFAITMARIAAIKDERRGAVSAEKAAEAKVLVGKAHELKDAIESLQAQEAEEKDLSELNKFLTSPYYRVPHGMGDGDGESDDRKALKRAGWEIKDGNIFAPTSLGQVVKMWPEEVLFGDIPNDDVDAAQFFTKTRASFRPEYRDAYLKLHRLAVRTRSEAMALSMLAPSEQKALSEGLDTAGGFVVPPDAQAEMLVRLGQQSVMRRLCRVQTTSRDILTWPKVAAASATQAGVASGGASIFTSGFTGSWVGETTALSDTDLSFEMFAIPIRKLRAFTKLSNDFVSDASVNILSFLSTNGSENLALVEDYGLIAGDGSALKPKGILNSGASTVDVEGSSSNTISNSSGAGTSNKIITLAYTLPSQYAGGASWLMTRVNEGKTFGLAGTDGRPIWPEYARSGLTAGAPSMLVGSPVYNSEFMPADGTDANKVYIYGNFQNYIIAQRAQITSSILRELYAGSDQVGIVLFERVGGDTWNTDAFRFGIV